MQTNLFCSEFKTFSRTRPRCATDWQ